MEPSIMTVPWKELVIPQFINFSLFMGLLTYYLSRPLRRHFSGKNEEFEVQRRRAEESRVQAERENNEVRGHLKTLEETADKSREEAKEEAASIKKRIIEEATETFSRMTEEAHKMAEFERLRAVATLKQEIIINAATCAEQELKKTVGEAAQSSLNDDFIKKVRAVTL